MREHKLIQRRHPLEHRKRRGSSGSSDPPPVAAGHDLDLGGGAWLPRRRSDRIHGARRAMHASGRRRLRSSDDQCQVCRQSTRHPERVWRDPPVVPHRKAVGAGRDRKQKTPLRIGPHKSHDASARHDPKNGAQSSAGRVRLPGHPKSSGNAPKRGAGLIASPCRPFRAGDQVSRMAAAARHEKRR